MAIAFISKCGSFSKCAFIFSFYRFPKKPIVNKNSFIDEVVNKQRNMYEAFKFVSAFKNL